jgi:hypothetical protein
VEGFGKMDEKSPLESVRKAAEKVEKGVKLAKGDNGLLVSGLTRSFSCLKPYSMSFGRLNS